MTIKPIPDGYRSVTPYIISDDPDALIQFLKQAFDAALTESITGEDGKTQHAEVKIGDSMVMLSPSKGEFKAMPCANYLYVPDTDATYKAAMAAGATSIMEPADMFYGDRNGGVQDPMGNFWWIATHIEDVSSEELQKRMQEQGKS